MIGVQRWAVLYVETGCGVRCSSTLRQSVMSYMRCNDQIWPRSVTEQRH